MKRPGILLLIGILLLLAYASSQGLLAHCGDRHWLAEYLAQHPLGGPLSLLGLAALLTAAGVPRQLPAALFGFLFGTLGGTLMGVLATTLGALLSYLVAGLLIGPARQVRFPARLLKFSGQLRANTFWATLSIRFLPVGSNLLTNLLAGALRVPPLPFLVASAIGYLPQTLIFALAGSGVGRSNEIELLLGALLCLASLVIAGKLLRGKRSLPPATSHEPQEDPENAVERTATTLAK